MDTKEKAAPAGTGTAPNTALAASNSTSTDRHYLTPDEVKALSASVPWWRFPRPTGVANHITLQAQDAAYVQARVLDAVERYRAAYPDADFASLATLAHAEMLARQEFRCSGGPT